MPPEPAAAGRQERFQHRLNRRAQHEVGVAHDSRGHLRGAVLPAGALGGDALDELDLAHRAQLLRSPGAVHGVALDEHRLGDVVASRQVLGELVQQETVARPVPEVVVRVADGQTGFQRLFHRQGQP